MPCGATAVEIDGPVHWDEAQSAYDLRRQAWLESEGNRVLRIQLSEITRSLGDVLDTIDGVLLDQEQLGFVRRPNQSRPRGPSGAPHPPPFGRYFPTNGEELASPHEWGGVGFSSPSDSYFGSSLIEALLMQ